MISLSLKITGINNIIKAYKRAPDLVAMEAGKALGRSVAMVETNVKKLTPKDTGYLRSSIGLIVNGGENTEPGYKFVRGLTAGIGTNVKYAVYVHERDVRHNVGQRKFMEVGAENTVPFIVKEFDNAMGRIASQLSK